MVVLEIGHSAISPPGSLPTFQQGLTAVVTTMFKHVTRAILARDVSGWETIVEATPRFESSCERGGEFPAER